MVTTLLYFAGYMVMKVPQAFWPLTILVVFDNGEFLKRGASNLWLSKLLLYARFQSIKSGLTALF